MERILSAGADCITGGNHTLRNRAAYSYLDDTEATLRPINFGTDAPGHGSAILNSGGYRVLVINAMGNVHIDPVLDAPFGFIDRALRREEGNYDIAILDIHAEATGEKLAVGHCYDGKISLIFGTHTHVPTADEQILPRGTGYITDVGMCGESGGIIGMDASVVVSRMRSHLPEKFSAACGDVKAEGVICEVDERDGRALSIKRISF